MRLFGGRLSRTPDAQTVGGGASSSVQTDSVVRFAIAVNSSINNRTGSVQLSLTGIAGLDYDAGEVDLADASKAESIDNAEQFSAPGVVGRPLPPRTINGVEEHLDVVALITADGLVPIAYRDTRIKMGGNAPGEGVFAFVGYGGGFHSMTPVAKAGDPSGGGTLQTIYCPYDFDSNGIAQKAHAIVLDPSPGNESMMLVHADGMALTLFQNSIVMKNAAGDATLRLDDDGITMTAVKIVLSGGVIVGNPNTAVPLIPSSASTVLLVSPAP